MTKVSPGSDLSAFLATLEKSGLLTGDEFKSSSEALADLPDAKSAARLLLKQNKLTRWQAGQLLHGYHQLVIGKYKLLEQLGSGELGRVYLGEHLQLGRRVALKMFSRRYTSDPQTLKGFLDDARRVAGLDHRNLCHIYDVNQEGERYFLVMEYVDGQDLQRLIDTTGQQPIGKTIEIVRQTAEGLAHAHDRKVIHGDLKPTNVIIDKSGTVKILDIGLSRLTESNATASVTASVEESGESPSLASGIYRPKEQTDGKGIDHRSDWYSLGGVLSFLLTGKPFLPSDSGRSIEKLKELRPDAPQELLVLCAAMLSDNPADRPLSITEVTAALAKAAVANVPAPSEPKAKAPAARSKAEGTAAAAMPAIKTNGDSNAGKPRKTPVARALVEKAAPAATAATAADETPTSELSDTMSFAINTSTPPKKAAVAAAAAVSTSDSTAKAPAIPKRASKLPLLIGGIAVGGMLLVACIVGLVVVLSRGGDEPEVAKNEPATANTSAAAEGESEDTREANPESAEANPESNPEEPPVVAAAVATPAPAIVEPPPASPPADPPTAANAAAAAPEPAAAPAEPPATAAPVPVEAAPPPPAPAPAPAAPEPPKPAAPKPAGNPFQGFATAVSLPKLPALMSEPTPEMLAPVVLGPCKVDAKALIIVRLLGGETAFKGGRQKFLLDAANNGTAERDWEIRCEGPGAQPEVIALLSAKNDQLTFQWSPEGAKNQASPFLSNCLMEFSAGAGHHQAALREPVKAEPLVIEIEKPNQSAKWNIDAMPDDKQIEVEIVAFESQAPKSKVENPLLTAEKDTAIVLAGTADDKLPLGIELKLNTTGRGIQLTAIPKIRGAGLSAKQDRYTKRALQSLVGNSETAKMAAEQFHMQANQIKDDKKKKAAIAQADQIKVEAGKFADQIAALQAVSESAKISTVHVRVWYLADTGKVLLLDTGGPPPKVEKK